MRAETKTTGTWRGNGNCHRLTCPHLMLASFKKVFSAFIVFSFFFLNVFLIIYMKYVKNTQDSSYVSACSSSCFISGASKRISTKLRIGS